jgi:DNA-3-methyladenine glycosylase II
MASRNGLLTRLLHVDGSPVVVRAWQSARDRVQLRADAIDPAAVVDPGVGPAPERRWAGPQQLEFAIERIRFALAVDDDHSGFHRAFRRDPLLAPLLRRFPHLRPRRRPWPWEALAWAVTEQLIEAERALAIQRRIVFRWGVRLPWGRTSLRELPSPDLIAGRAPAELQSLDLAAGRAIALRSVAGLLAGGRCDPGEQSADPRLLAVPGIGPWTIQRLALHGRGDPDSLPAGDLAYLKLVGRLAGEGRRATVEEVEEFYAPYAPYRALAGHLTLVGLGHRVKQGPRLRLAA